MTKKFPITCLVTTPSLRHEILTPDILRKKEEQFMATQRTQLSWQQSYTHIDPHANGRLKGWGVKTCNNSLRHPFREQSARRSTIGCMKKNPCATTVLMRFSSTSAQHTIRQLGRETANHTKEKCGATLPGNICAVLSIPR